MVGTRGRWRERPSYIAFVASTRKGATRAALLLEQGARDDTTRTPLREEARREKISPGRHVPEHCVGIRDRSRERLRRRCVSDPTTRCSHPWFVHHGDGFLEVRVEWSGLADAVCALALPPDGRRLGVNRRSGKQLRKPRHASFDRDPDQRFEADLQRGIKAPRTAAAMSGGWTARGPRSPLRTREPDPAALRNGFRRLNR